MVSEAAAPQKLPIDQALARWDPWLRRLCGLRARPFRLPFDDLFQEARLCAVQYYPAYDPARGSLGNWLVYQVAMAAARLRAQRRRSVLTVQGTVRGFGAGQDNSTSDSLGYPTGLAAYLSQAVADLREPDPADEANRRERVARLSAALAALPPRRRELFLRAYAPDPAALYRKFTPSEKAEVEAALAALRESLRGLVNDE